MIIALRLQAELDEELRVERERQEEASKVAIAEMFDEVHARIDADYELTARMTQEEQEKYPVEERASHPNKPKVNASEKDVIEEEAAEYEKERKNLEEKKYPLVKELLEKMLNLQLQAEEESTMAFELSRFIKSLLEEYKVFDTSSWCFELTVKKLDD
ncbi:hypothetical protein Tco_1053040 [Tanacetum coccineum]